MPIYEYRCRNGHEFEVFQKMSDDPVERCTECDSPVERMFRPVAVHFKGSGFYSTDYGKGKSKPKATDSGSGEGDKASSKDESKAGSASSKKTDD